VSGEELFSVNEIARWLSHRQIPRNGLKPDESPGITYGDRFGHNGGVSANSDEAETSHQHTGVNSVWRSQLEQIADLLRSDLELLPAVEFIMSMLYVRGTNQERWRAVTAQRSWDSVRLMLEDLPSGEHDVPLLTTVASDPVVAQQMMEAIRLFDEIDFNNVGPAVIFDALLEKVDRDFGMHGGHFTPRSLVRCMVDILDPQSTNSVFDPFCGSGELLAAAAERGVESVSGQATNGRSLRMSLLNISMYNSEAEVRIGGLEIDSGASRGEEFDFVLSNPPFNITLPDRIDRYPWPFEVPTQRSVNFAWLQIALDKLKPGGRAAVLMPNGTLFGELNAEIRRKMIDAGVIEAIIALPARLFTDTGIAVSLWLIRRPKPSDPLPTEILFIYAADMGAMSDRAQRVLGEEEIAKIVEEYREWRESGHSDNFGDSAGFARPASIEEIQRNRWDLQPLRYVREGTDSRSSSPIKTSTRIGALQQELDELTERSKRTRHTVDADLKALITSTVGDWREVPLSDVCTVQTGPGAVDRERGLEVTGWTPLVLPRNIKRGHLSHDELDTIRPETSAKFVKYKIQQGDIVCARSGTVGRHGLVSEQEDGWLLGPSCMRLRPNGDEVVPEYLVHYLNSSDVVLWIESEARRSTVIPHITATTMRALVIPLPTIAVQETIAATMNSIDLSIEQHRQAASATQSLRDVVFPALMRS
jgi:type I restriction enzyme M protein